MAALSETWNECRTGFWASPAVVREFANLYPVAVDAALVEDRGWIGVDLDGTLAEYRGWKGPGEIGPPIPSMVARVKDMLENGYEVKIFTARGTEPSEMSRRIAFAAIRGWCVKHLGVELSITSSKDLNMIELWDDRAIQVMHNEGVPVPGQVSKVFGVLGMDEEN